MMTVTTIEASKDIGKLLDTASEEPVMIERDGKPTAIVLSLESYQHMATIRPARQFGCGRHLLSGAAISVNDLLAVPIEETFSEYLPNDSP